MGDKKKLKAEGVIELDKALDYIRSLTARLSERRVAVRSQGRAMVAEIPDLVEFELEVEEKEGKTEISVEIEWKEGMEPGPDLDLKISSPEDPEVAECLRTELAAQSPPECAQE
jgi:amphi-Trp domain-containing protein